MKFLPLSKILVKAVVLFSIVLVCSVFITGCGATDQFTDGSIMLYGSEGSDTSILVIQSGNLFGYADVNGTILIKPKYAFARPFHEGLAAVKHGKKYGYIDTTGKVVIPFKYNDALDFQNGKTIVGTEYFKVYEVDYPKSCILDVNGHELYEYEYGSVDIHHDGLSYAQYIGGGVFLDENYEPIEALRKIYYSVSDFNEGLSPFACEKNQYSYMDMTGNVAFPDVFYEADIFRNGLAPVMPDGKTALWGYIDKSGQYAVAPIYRKAGIFGEGLACVETTSDDWMIIDTQGNKVCTINCVVGKIYSFSEGLCAVGKYKEKHVAARFTDQYFDWGFIDTSGNLVIDFQYDSVTAFKNSIAQVLVGGKIGYIDRTGKYIWEPK